MRLTRRETFAAILVGAVAVRYMGYLAGGRMPFDKDTRGMAEAALILGLVALAALGALTWTGALAGIVSVGLGIATVWAEDNEVLLGFFIVSLVIAWVLGTLSRGGPDAPKPG